MTKKPTTLNLPPRFWPWLAVSAGLGLLALAGLTMFAYATQQKTIVRGVTIAGQPVGGLMTSAAAAGVQRRWDNFTAQAFSFTAAGRNFSVPAGTTSTAEEVIVGLVELDIARAVDQAYKFGHQGSWWRQARERLSGFIGREHRFGTLVFDRRLLAAELQKKLAGQEQAPVDAGLTISGANAISITPSQTGLTFDYAGAVSRAYRKLTRLDPTAIVINQVTVQPAVVNHPQLMSVAAAQVPSLLALAPLKVYDRDKSWEISRQQLIDLLGFINDDQAYTVSLDETKTSAWLSKLKAEIETQPQNAKFEIVNGKVKEFQTSAVGRLVDVAATISQMRRDFIAEQKNKTSLVMTEVKPVTDTTSTNDLGITELVAEGRTNFRRSPPNRRYNLTYGSKILNGILIAPGETFSLVKALGKIDAAHGWKSELVIKGQDIKPEYGGGLCQVATTLFRAVLNAGLPIVERKNHSLRISYYEPPIGLDATIYEPKPDLRFTNDYTFYLLLQTRVEGDNLIYSFYGTKDGRQVNIPEPRVYNRVPIPPTQTVEVDDLKPGVKECQAPGHPGADATATYTVTKVDGSSVTQTFQSHYRPIPIICRVGKKVES